MTVVGGGSRSIRGREVKGTTMPNEGMKIIDGMTM
jgi:hypothetical protein